MAKLVLKKYPKKPKLSASTATIQNYFDRCKEVDKENTARKSEHNAQKAAAERLRKFKPGKSKTGGVRKRRSSPKRKSAKRKK